MHAINHYSPDVLKGHAGVALPLAFLGMHQAPGPDEDKEKSHDATLWAEVWQENVPGECSWKKIIKKLEYPYPKEINACISVTLRFFFCLFVFYCFNI